MNAPLSSTWQEVTLANPATREEKLTARACPVLSLHRIAHLGWNETPAPYRIVRLQPTGSYVLVCLSGEGRILLDGRWQRCLPGTACLAPPRILNAFHAVPGKQWHFCWVRYDEPPGQAALVHSQSPVRVTCNPILLFSAIRGLIAEQAGAAENGLLHHWVELVHGLASRLAKPWHVDEKLGRIWAAVAGDLSAPWSTTELARRAHCSKEHLRRLCLRELGRTPLQQVTYMRIQRAAEILRQESDKLETIANAVGYSNAFVLSKVFKKWIGCAPAEYRRRADES